jgi:hypothetical protein
MVNHKASSTEEYDMRDFQSTMPALCNSGHAIQHSVSSVECQMVAGGFYDPPTV